MVHESPGNERGEFGADELGSEEAFELPDRRAMSLLGLGSLGGGLVGTGQATPDPTQLTGQQVPDPAQASQPVADATGLGSQAAGAAQSAATAPQGTYQPAVTTTAQS